MDREMVLQNAIADAEDKLNYMAIFRQETGEEGLVHLTDGMTIDEACERYPEWSFRGTEVVRDHAWHEFQEARENYEHWYKTKNKINWIAGYMDSLIYDQ